MTNFTKQQQEAIDTQGKDILVSASAGSGKTTVLVQRLMKEILSGTSVDQLLVVTFTKAAAQEMKTRIKAVLQKSSEEDNANQNYLRQQLNLVDTANISTIDAFCLDVIHRFYYIIDIDPSFSILTDETQAELMREHALHDIEDKMLLEKDADFLAFYNNFAGDRDAETARNLLLDLYDYAMAKPDYQSWLKQLNNKYQIGEKVVTSDLWQQQIKPYLLSAFSPLVQKLNQLSLTDFSETKYIKFGKNFTSFAKRIANYYNALKNDQNYDQQRELLQSCVFEGRVPSNKKLQEVDLEELGEVKKEAANLVFDTFTSFYATDEVDQLDIMRQGNRIMTAITNAELALIDRFNQLKREENLIDYSDMEQLAYQILSQDTSSSQMAREFYQNKFKEILVDEYQDINVLQEKILQLIKKKNQNYLFMVGDVKQSIYGFRQAEPSLFLHKYHAAAQESNHDQKRILLSDNFRSTDPVVKLVNHIFNNILTPDFGGIDYAQEGQLKFGAKYYPKLLPQAAEFIYPQKDDKNSEDEKSSAAGTNTIEIKLVIERIKQFRKENLQVFDTHSGEKRPFKYSDIVILTRSRSDNLTIMQEFSKQNLPLLVTDAKNYFQTLELTVIMNYLRIIDNPDQDIPLVAVLRSPLFNFKEPDLAKIRVHSKKTGFYDALIAYVSVNDKLGKQVKNFLNQLDELRLFAVNHRISELIWSIYEKTNLLEIMTALTNGKQRRINLESLYERATSYESAGFKGLYQFINFIERMRRNQKDLAQPLVAREADDTVRLMTVHSSKGLEFPIVFYIGMQHKFQKRDLSGNYIITSNNVGLTIRQPKYRIDSLVKSIDNVLKQRQLLEEEARILYVGMTRAKQKLILVSNFLNSSNYENELSQTSLYNKLHAQTPFDLIANALKLEQHSEQKICEISSALDNDEKLIISYYCGNFNDTESIVSHETTSKKFNNLELLNKTTQQLYDFNYPFKDASQTTAYQSVSEIKKAFNDPLDEELENAQLLSSANRYLEPIDTKPNFLFKTKFTGSEIGTAMHLILQYYDYEGKGDIEQLNMEIQNLIKQNKLQAEIVPSLHKEQIDWFVHSDFAQQFWQKPKQLKREVDFSSLLAARTLFPDFSDSNAKILIHGTIDGYFIGNDGIILFDYKTDHIDIKHWDKSITNIKKKYTGQLRLYEQALNSFSQEKVSHKYLVLLDVKMIVEID
ncbi:helicase-exonuclease AddAB subunit AddA [Lactobacillus sp. ESL0228]|uniref:helicase-exonuclease AddAB subunit AddA n=1 Tax=Lactobacillus sp. ESL0228 TaxID=2069352 RepID=UPI000EFBEAF4|nr:helicase-exonuclease AddAB subunit AddA [Lactobacillus sp. ESL0228]RMC48804.1 helicase-exonuclease AddAB subunit AddA [Lactobacillus sp. ESL0228]